MTLSVIYIVEIIFKVLIRLTDNPKYVKSVIVTIKLASQYITKKKYIIFFYSKVYIEFPSSNFNSLMSDNNQGRQKVKQLIPGNICFGVYVAIKMFQLKHNFKIPLLKLVTCYLFYFYFS